MTRKDHIAIEITRQECTFQEAEYTCVWEKEGEGGRRRRREGESRHGGVKLQVQLCREFFFKIA
jgi:hypothetical protein